MCEIERFTLIVCYGFIDKRVRKHSRKSNSFYTAMSKRSQQILSYNYGGLYFQHSSCEALSDNDVMLFLCDSLKTS